LPEYTIKEIDISNNLMKMEASQLLNKVFNLNMHADYIYLNTYIQGSKNKSLYLGAFINGELVGFNAYISHDFICNNELVNCFQACWSATSPQHRNKGIYYNLRETAKYLLKEKGAAFIFCYPNQNTKNILLNSLGFKVIGTLYIINILNLRFLIDSLFNKWRESYNLLMKDSYFQNDYQLIQLKKQQYGDDIKIISDNENMVWGKIHYKKRYGLRIKYFEVGGMIVNNPHGFKCFVEKLMADCKVTFIQFAIHSSSCFRKLFKKYKIYNEEPLMIYELNGKHLEKRFNLFSGVRDTF
jgi:hypothetical protein